MHWRQLLTLFGIFGPIAGFWAMVLAVASFVSPTYALMAHNAVFLVGGFALFIGGMFIGYRFGYLARYHIRYDGVTGQIVSDYGLIRSINKVSLTAKMPTPPVRYTAQSWHFFVVLMIFFTPITWLGIETYPLVGIYTWIPLHLFFSIIASYISIKDYRSIQQEYGVPQG